MGDDATAVTLLVAWVLHIILQYIDCTDDDADRDRDRDADDDDDDDADADTDDGRDLLITLTTHDSRVLHHLNSYTSIPILTRILVYPP